MRWITKPKLKMADQLVEGTPWPSGVFFDAKLNIMYVVTIHGQKTVVQYGDFIVQEPDGTHHYPCKPEIWLAGHESLEDCTCDFNGEGIHTHHRSCTHFGGF